MPLEPRAPKIERLENVISKCILDGIKGPLDLIKEPETISELLYNASVYRAAYINWRTYATALENYYNSIVDIMNSDAEGENNAISITTE